MKDRELKIANIPCLLIELDNKGKITGFSRKFLSHYNLNEEELLGADFSEIFPLHEKQWEKLLGSTATEIILEGKIAPPGEQSFPVKAHFQSSGSGKERRIYGSFSPDEKKVDSFKKLLESVPLPLCQVNNEGKLIFINRRFKTFFGYTLEDVPDLDHWWKKAYPDEEYRKWVLQTWNQAVEQASEKDEDIESIAYRVTNSHGEERSIIISGVVLKESFLATFIDITDRLRMEEANARLARFVDNNEDLVTITDPEGRLTYVNQASSKVYGLSPQEIIGRLAFDFIHPDDKEQTLQAFNEWLTSEEMSISFENRQVSRNGTICTMLWNIQKTYDSQGKVESFWAFARDISSLKEVQNKLLQSNKELEQFAYVASHDLQEPLRMVRSYTQLLAERYEGELDEKADRYINYAVEGSARMQQLINDLLSLSRVGTKGKKFVEVNCNDLLDEVLNNLESAIKESGATVNVGELPVLKGDRTQLMQLFQNLIGNALKFQGEKVPDIRVSAEKIKDKWEFRIKDNGIGIAPEYHDRIFTVFQRLHERGRYPGTGIGLAIVKKITERHGGTIRVESSPGKGTTFIVNIKADMERKSENGK